VLERHGPSDADPQWSFTPQPPFGQEPDLGLDRRSDDDPRHDPPTDASRHDPPTDDRTLFDRPPEVVPRR
jgi:hypothetical protein